VSFTEIDPFVTEEEKQYFFTKIHEDNWYQHKSTHSGKLTPLKFKKVEYRGVVAGLMMMDPNTTMGWHTDGTSLNRNTIILHPLTDNYSPFVCEDGSSSKPIIANTQARHAVFNNGNIRLNLQFEFSDAYNDVHSDKNSVVWKLLNKFYKENNEQR
jgi:hypothetical protein